MVGGVHVSLGRYFCPARTSHLSQSVTHVAPCRRRSCRRSSSSESDQLLPHIGAFWSVPWPAPRATPVRSPRGGRPRQSVREPGMTARLREPHRVVGRRFAERVVKEEPVQVRRRVADACLRLRFVHGDDLPVAKNGSAGRTDVCEAERSAGTTQMHNAMTSESRMNRIMAPRSADRLTATPDTPRRRADVRSLRRRSPTGR